MSRENYLASKVTCDKCGTYDYYDCQSIDEDDLNSHIDAYYTKVDGLDYCDDCYEQYLDEQKEKTNE